MTATKRNTRLQDTPLAITAFTADQIPSQRLYNLTDIALRTPGLEFIPYSRQEAYVSIRGTTTNSAAAGADLGVTVFIDDVPTIGVGDNDPDLFDLASIEVLRGPQGTLFGRNVTGGALLVHTLSPSFETHASTELTYGNFNLFEVRSYLTGPLVGDTLAGKVAFQYRRQDGIVDNVTLGRHDLSTDAIGGRAQLLWKPLDRFKLLIGGDYASDTSPYKTTQLIGNFQPSVIGPLSYSPDATNEGIHGTGDARNGGALVRADLSLATGTLTSISGFRDVYDRNYHSTSAEPFNELLQTAVQKGNQFTEELRFASRDDRRVSFVAGLFFLNAHREYRTVYDLNIKPGVLVSFVPPYSVLRFSSTSDQKIDAYSYAAFGEAKIKITSRLALTLGGRFTDERKTGSSLTSNTSGLSAPLDAPYYAHNWNAFTPKATLSYQPSRALLAYATFSTGFKSGGYDTSGTSVTALTTPFRPEKVTNYEGGVKATLFHNRLSVDVGGYYADYRDLQLNQYNQQLLQFITGNAGQSKIPGVEVQISADPLNWLSVSGSYAYVGANYSHYVSGENNYSGHQIPFDAKNQVHLGGEAHTAVQGLGGGQVRFGGDVTWRSSVHFDDQNDEPAFLLNPTSIKGLVNLHLTYTTPSERWQISAWGKNINNARYLIVASDLTPFYANVAEYRSPVGNKIYAGDWNTRPTFGLSLTYKQ